MRGRRLSWLHLLVLVLAILSFSTEQAAVYASPKEQEVCYSSYDWQELEMGSFVLIFPTHASDLAQKIYGRFPEDLETMVENYSRAFSVDLVLPVTIRVYPTHADYYCVNPLAPVISESTAHSHLGQREIAVIDSAIQEDLETWDRQVLYGFQHELAVLFAEEITGGYAPPGLLKGLGGYAENPQETFNIRFETADSPSEPDIGWQTLWDGEVSLADERALLQSISTVAYLIDVHGWGKFLDFLDQIKIEQGYRQAITEVYSIGLQGLQSHWRTYFPVYVGSRWEANIFHNYDLDVYRQLISSGAYIDSVSGLAEAVSLIDIFGDQTQRQAAQELFGQAEMGMKAGELTLQSRQALLAGKYVESFTTAEEALKLYDQLGDTRRKSELEIYMTVAKEVLDLRAGLEVISEQGIGINPLKNQEIFDIGQRLLELGDLEGVSQAERIMLLLGASRNTFFRVVVLVFVMVSLGLIARRILSLRRPTPPEADLL
jgi:hypothetical protein